MRPKHRRTPSPLAAVNRNSAEKKNVHCIRKHSEQKRSWREKLLINDWKIHVRFLFHPPLGTNSNKVGRLFSAVGCVYSITLQIIHELKNSSTVYFRSSARGQGQLGGDVNASSPKNQLNFLMLRGSFCKQTHEFWLRWKCWFSFCDKIFYSVASSKKIQFEFRHQIEFIRFGWMVRQIATKLQLTPHCWIRNFLFASAGVHFPCNSIHVCIIYEINIARRLQGCNYF